MIARADSAAADALSRLKDPSGAVLFFIAMLAALVTLPMAMQVGSISTLAVLTILIAGSTFALWLARPWFPLGRAVWIIVPLAFYVIYSGCTIAWYAYTVKGMQLLMVLLAFLGVVLLTAREVDRRPAFGWALMKVLDWAFVLSSAAYLLTVPLYGMGNENLFAARGFAIFALLGVARMLARWQQGDKMAFVYASMITAAIVLSVSRTAMFAAVAMFPIAAMSRVDRRGVVNAILMAVVGSAVLTAFIMFSPGVKERFFGFDTSMSVGGVAINASGRQEMWNAVLKSAQTTIVFGQGIGSSAILIDTYFTALAHPHNDYLRLLHDEGIVGLSFYVGFLVVGLVVLGYRGMLLGRRKSRTTQFYLAAALSILGIAASHATDNTISYSFVMMPFGLIMGCALGMRETAITHSEPTPRRRAQSSGTPQGPFGRRRFPRSSRPAIAIAPGMSREKGVA